MNCHTYLLKLFTLLVSLLAFSTPAVAQQGVSLAALALPTGLTVAAANDDFSLTSASLAFGSVPNTQSKSLTFRAESKKVSDYTVTVTAPFTVSPSSGHFGLVGTAIGTASDTITVTLPANLPPGARSGTVTVEFRLMFPLGNAIKVRKTVALSATVTDPNAPAGFDLTTTLQNGGELITANTRRVSVDIFAIVQGGSTSPFKTRMLVSVDGAADIQVFNQPIIYAPGSGQKFVLAHDIPVSAKTITFRIISDPDNTAVEINESNNTKTLTRSFN